MVLTESQIERIRQVVHGNGITLDELAESLIDHICCLLEGLEDMEFEAALTFVMNTFSPEGLKRIELETIQLINRKEIIMKKTMYVLGYLAAILSTSGLMFKIQHWTGASVMLILGVFILNFGFLPLYFFQRFKKA